MLIIALFDEMIDLTIDDRYLETDIEQRKKELLEELYKGRVLNLESSGKKILIKDIKEVDEATYAWLNIHYPKWIRQFAYGKEQEKHKHNNLHKKHKASINKYIKNNQGVSRGTFLRHNEAAGKWLSKYEAKYLEEILVEVESKHRNRLFTDNSKRVLECIKKYPYKTRSQIAKETGAAYVWLWNNEPEWVRAVTRTYYDELEEVHRYITREYMKKYPKASIKEFRAEHNSSYEWMRINDPIWFNGQFFSKSLKYFKKHLNIIRNLMDKKLGITREEVLEQEPVSYMWMKRNKKGWIESNLLEKKKEKASKSE